ncbi:hypothetical protein [Fodinicurvata sediminis]|uniref:hypothetical protein n=1 Tax=Fodinicurvata sediminis TaxID=1121832 RepID=UPI0003B332AB|nr:hypothetical protein [Fodinicurvata sediminis]
MPDGGGVLNIQFKPPGPVAARFMSSTAMVQAIMGPIGGGKTSCCFMKAIRLAQKQRPSPLTGVRHFKLCVVRDTYRQLWSTTIPSWNKWVPRELGNWVGASGGPATHTILFELAPGDRVEFILEFVAIGDNNVEDVLKGYEPTAFYLNEADLLSEEVFTYALGRAGRYPAKDHGGPSWYGILMDFNAPDEDNYLCDQVIYKRPKDWAFFKQPSGLSGQAENLENLPPDYYQKQCAGQPDWYIRRMIKNQIGYSRHGMPVFDDFSDDLHVASQPLQAVPELPLRLGADAGRTPAVIVGQVMANGQWRILEEILAENMGAKTFGKMVKRILGEHYPGLRIAAAHGDPASAFAGDQDEMSWLEIFSSATEVPWTAAPGGNALSLRLEAVRDPLNRLIDGAPGLLISPDCLMIRKGFNSGYRYRRMAGGSGRYDDKPEKNEYSHPHDALQNLLLGGGEGDAALGRRRSEPGKRQTRAIDDERWPRGEYDRGGRQAYALD